MEILDELRCIRQALQHMLSLPEQIANIERKLDQMAVTQQQFDTDLNTFGTQLTGSLANFEAAYQGAINKAAAGEDFTAEDNIVQGFTSALGAAAQTFAAQPTPPQPDNAPVVPPAATVPPADTAPPTT